MAPRCRTMTPFHPAVLDEAPLGALLVELRREARALRFEVAPNPTVGAALLAGGREVARGYHRFFGGPHAEVDAIERARASDVPPAAWDTLVVTLEPCSSHGKTPPCTAAILALRARSGLRRVVVGAVDPDARHAGGGLELLREAGLEVELLPLPAGRGELPAIDPHFARWTHFERLRRPRPWTILKWAQTRSGQLQPPEDVGGGRWISSPAALSEVQLLRGRVDAIVTGIGTVLADDPRLSVRPPGALGRPPRRIVLDGHLRTPPESRLFAPREELDPTREAAGPVTLLARAGLQGQAAVRRRALLDRGVEVISMPVAEGGGLSLRAVHSWLAQEGLTRVLVEAGPTLLESHLEGGFADQLRVYTGEVNGGRGPSMGPWFARLALRDRLDREAGPDAVLEAFLEP